MWSRAPPLLAGGSAHRRIVHARPHGTQNGAILASASAATVAVAEGGRAGAHRAAVAVAATAAGLANPQIVTLSLAPPPPLPPPALLRLFLMAPPQLRSCSLSTPQRVAPVPPESVVAAAGRAGPL
jgi:hypothetical protein